MRVAGLGFVGSGIRVLHFVDLKLVGAAGGVLFVHGDSSVLLQWGAVLEDLDVRHRVTAAVEHQGGGGVFDKFSVFKLDEEDGVAGLLALLLLGGGH